MKIIEQTPTRLVFTSGLPYVQNFRCEFDRSTGRARVTGTSFFMRSKPVEFALTDIAAAQTWTESSGESASDMLALVLKSGERVNLPMPSYGNTSSFKKIVALVNGFLAA